VEGDHVLGQAPAQPARVGGGDERGAPGAAGLKQRVDLRVLLAHLHDDVGLAEDDVVGRLVGGDQGPRDRHAPGFYCANGKGLHGSGLLKREMHAQDAAICVPKRET
jgi:hypothetical protein